MPEQAADHSLWRFGQRMFLAGGQVQEPQPAQAVFVECVGEQLPVVGKRRVFHVPLVVGEVLRLAACQLDAGDPLEFVFPVGSRLDGLAVRAESDGLVSDLLEPFGRQRSLSTGGDINEPEVALVN